MTPWQASSTGLADPAYGLDARLSWSERRKLERYEKQVARDALKRGKAEERERRREEKVLAKQWKAFYKQQEKETKAWRKATAHHPELNYPPARAIPASSSGHHHSFHLHSPHVSHHGATRPLPRMVPAHAGAYQAQYLPVGGVLGQQQQQQQAPLLPSLAAFGVVDPRVAPEQGVMSRCVFFLAELREGQS
ncbi:hypothetical protein NCC49_000184 [Naganishia albida]|nr:hypothetical protein NCC49_000184 [Naganishia albida]